MRILVIGGGFFGMYLAETLSRAGHEIKIIESASGFMTRASLANQARVHNGYHYPRSVLTALRSRVLFPRFTAEFQDCIDAEFEQYYLIGKSLSKVSAQQFLKFCERIGAPCRMAPPRVQKFTNPALIEACFATVEYAFDAVKLRDVMAKRLMEAQVKTVFNAAAQSVSAHKDGLSVQIHHHAADRREDIFAHHVFNCTYSHMNFLLANSQIELIPLKHEMTELCLVQVPEAFKNLGMTVMCGPFFSFMPHPASGLHSFSHCRYTPHYEWKDEKDRPYQDAALPQQSSNSAWRYMQKDAARYVPLLSDCCYERSLWEIKTVLPASESDDSRPILFYPHHGLKGFHCIMGGKINNVYDVIEEIHARQVLAHPREVLI